MNSTPAPTKRRCLLPDGDSVPRHEDCWAKTTAGGSPGINVKDHCVNVACVAEALLGLLPNNVRGLCPRGSVSLAALHDVGKVSPGFQVKCEAWLIQHGLRERALKEGWSSGYQSDHARVSQATVEKLLGVRPGGGWPAVVGAHHGRIKGSVNGQPWEHERLRLARELIAAFGPLPDASPTDATLALVAGLTTIADWIGSDEHLFPQDAVWNIEERRQRASAALAAIGWRTAAARTGLEFQHLFPHITHPNSLQSTTLVMAHEPGVYVVEGPMGCGKTEAALAAAYQLIATGKATGLYFALPTQVTSNRIHLRVQPFIERISSDGAAVRLAHGTSWLIDIKPPLEIRAVSNSDDAREDLRAWRSWFASGKRALLTRYGVGTIDQALLGIVAAKHFFVRQFGLCGKVVILDEVHTYDLYTGTLITALVNRLKELGCTILILSATLTERRRRELLGLPDHQVLDTAYPLVSGVAGSFWEQACDAPPPKTVTLRHIRGPISVLEVLAHAEAGECVLWIRNTVDEAQASYRVLREASPAGGVRLALLHARFPFFRREQLESEWMERLGKNPTTRPPGCVLVSTQVVEQSVDIDADLLITDLAPTDMLLQRIGRLWRHERDSRPCSGPEVWIQMPRESRNDLCTVTRKELRAALGKSVRVYAPYVLLRSLREWSGRHSITLPADIRQILEATYSDSTPTEPNSWQELREELEKEKQTLADLAYKATAIWTNPALPDDEGIQTRYGGVPTAMLLPAYAIEAHDKGAMTLHLLSGEKVTASAREWSLEVAKAIHRNLVRIPLWAVAGRLQSAPCLANYVFREIATGVVLADGRIRLPDGDSAVALRYETDMGIIIERIQGEETIESYD